MSAESIVYEFGEFRFEPQEARLSRGGELVTLEPKAVEVLGRMVAQPGHLHGRDALLDAVWGHRHVTPSALNRIMTLLRHALGDQHAKPRFIETVPRRGYRFISPVRIVERASVPASASPVPSPFNPPPLPSPIGSQVAREVELAILQRMLRETRLLTLSGPGGIGKTRLALHLARRCQSAYPDGAWLVDLGTCRNGAEVDEALLGAFGFVRQGAASNAVLLVEALQQRRLLLLLDNCERVAGPVAALATRLLQHCPGLCILATSQVRLGVEGEQGFRVPPLGLPPDDWEHADDPLAAACSSEAVRLLELRARESDPGFVLGADNIGVVVRLCRYLEGLPLALELAASRLRVLGPGELLDRLSARREVLVSDWSGGPDRQHSVREMLDWSFDLLSPAEAELLRRLTLFSGGWTLDAAEAVMTDATGSREVVGPMGSLIDKSFVFVEHDAVPRRFRMLQAVRDYAGERLREDPHVNVYRLRQLHHYIALTASADAILYDRPMHRYGGLLDREQVNIRNAFDFALDNDLAAEALELALNLRWYWWIVGSFQTARDWIARALQAHPSPSLEARAKALQFIGLMELHLSRPEAEPVLEEAVALTAQAGLPREHGMALAGLAMVRIASGRFPEARRMLAHAMRRAIEAGDMHVRAYARIWVTAMHSMLGRHRLALISSRFAVSELGSFWAERNSGPGFLSGFAQVNLGLQSLLLGDATSAAQAFDRTLSLSATLRNLRMSGAALEGFAHVLALRGQAALGARLLGGAQRLRELTGVPMSRHWQAAHRRIWETLQGELGDEQAARMFEAGRHDRQQHLQALLYAAYPSMGLASTTMAST
jgi:non-specific serine/threonine protein kinase